MVCPLFYRDGTVFQARPDSVRFLYCNPLPEKTQFEVRFDAHVIYVYEIGVAYREDVDEVIEVIKKLDEDMRNEPEYKDIILEPIEILGLDKFGDSAVVIKARNKTKPVKQWMVGREFNRRMKKKFDELGIEIPFPHTTLYIGEDKKGESPPLHVLMEDGGKKQ